MFATLAAGCAARGTTVMSGGEIDAERLSRRSEQKNAGYCERSGCDSVPEVLVAPAPTYPPELLASRVAGEVTLRFEIAESGLAENPQVVHSSAPGFTEAALKALAQWRFKPAVKNGKPVRLPASQTFEMRP
ncbi:energy transducer TonB [Vulcaniibacterium thermophilum]